MLELQDIPLRSAPFVWFVAGGWALDLYLGRQTRLHSDLDLGILRCDQLLLQEYLAEWSLDKIVNGTSVAWGRGEFLSLPVHELHARKHGGNKVEILLSESADSNWVYRRDPRISYPLACAILEVSPGLKVLAPEIVLLFKSKNPRQQDQTDLENVLPNLSGEQRQWLVTSLKITDRSHDWVARLSK